MPASGAKKAPSRSFTRSPSWWRATFLRATAAQQRAIGAPCRVGKRLAEARQEPGAVHPERVGEQVARVDGRVGDASPVEVAGAAVERLIDALERFPDRFVVVPGRFQHQ